MKRLVQPVSIMPGQFIAKNAFLVDCVVWMHFLYHLYNCRGFFGKFSYPAKLSWWVVRWWKSWNKNWLLISTLSVRSFGIVPTKKREFQTAYNISFCAYLLTQGIIQKKESVTVWSKNTGESNFSTHWV